MYNGYKLKIDGVVFPNSYIAKGTYYAVNKKRVVEIWKDANQVEHEITAGTPKANISFSLIEHDSTTHSKMIAFFQKEDDIVVEFYDDKKDTYREAICRLEAIKWGHRSSYGGKIQYKATAITLIEN